MLGSSSRELLKEPYSLMQFFRFCFCCHCNGWSFFEADSSGTELVTTLLLQLATWTVEHHRRKKSYCTRAPSYDSSKSSLSKSCCLLLTLWRLVAKNACAHFFTYTHTHPRLLLLALLRLKELAKSSQCLKNDSAYHLTLIFHRLVIDACSCFLVHWQLEIFDV